MEFAIQLSPYFAQQIDFFLLLSDRSRPQFSGASVAQGGAVAHQHTSQ